MLFINESGKVVVLDEDKFRVDDFKHITFRVNGECIIKTDKISYELFVLDGFCNPSQYSWNQFFLEYKFDPKEVFKQKDLPKRVELLRERTQNIVGSIGILKEQLRMSEYHYELQKELTDESEAKVIKLKASFEEISLIVDCVLE